MVYLVTYQYYLILSEFPANMSLPKVYSCYSELYKYYIYIVYKDVNSENKWKSPSNVKLNPQVSTLIGGRISNINLY